MSIQIPHWVKRSCQIWGSQKRRAWLGESYYIAVNGDWRVHVDVYANSIFGKLRDERVGAGSPGGVRGQYWPEVFLNEGLDVQRTLKGMPGEAYDVLHLHYVFDPRWNLSVGRKSRMLGLRRVAYYEALGVAETWIFSRLEAAETLEQL